MDQQRSLISALLLSHLSSSSLAPSPPPCASPGSAADCPPPPSEHLHPRCWWPPGTCPGTAGAMRAAGPEVLYWPAQPELPSVEELLPLSAGEKSQPSSSVTWPLERSTRHTAFILFDTLSAIQWGTQTGTPQTQAGKQDNTAGSQKQTHTQ